MAQPSDPNTLGEIVLRLIESEDGWRRLAEVVFPHGIAWLVRTPDQGQVTFASTPRVEQELRSFRALRYTRATPDERQQDMRDARRMERIYLQRAAERTFDALRRDVETRTGYVKSQPLPAGHTVLELDAPRERFLEQLQRLEAEIRSGQVFA